MMDAHSLFEILVREHAEMLMVYLRSVVSDTNVADDLFQETMLTAWRRLDDFDRSRPFGPWLRGIAKKLVLAWRRKAVGLPRLCDEEALSQIDGQFESLQRLKGDTFGDKLDALHDCLDGLPNPYREAIQLRYREELKPSEMTNQLKLNAETVKKRLQRARAMLLDCMNGKLLQIRGVT